MSEHFLELLNTINASYGTLRTTDVAHPSEVKWTGEADRAFTTLKRALTTSTIMRNPDFTKPFTIQTNTSMIRVGAVLSQEERPIAYFSRKLTAREQKYATVEQECLAVVLGIKAFEVYLIGKPFILQTDHHALQWLGSFKDKNGRLMQWSLMLQPYSFTMQHRAGSQNGNDDALSRLPRNPCFTLLKEEGDVTGASVSPIPADLQAPPDLADHLEPDCLG